jgi:rsbT co-antagonist protein RsbR
VSDARLEELARLLLPLVSRAPNEHATSLDEILSAARALAENQERSTRRLDELMNVVLALVSFNYAKKATVSEANDVYDGLAYAVNMLAEELAASTVSKSFVDDIIESLRDALLVIDKEGTIHAANAAALALFARPRKEVVEQSLKTLLPELPLTTITNGTVYESEHHLARPDGTDVPFTLTVSSMRAGQGAGRRWVCVLRDLTHTKKLEEERWRMREALQRQAILVEELSTPLIPLTKDLVVLPLVGSLDHERSAQIAETLLKGIVDRKARIAIIDVTGVRGLDAEGIDGLLRCVQSGRLLGAKMMLTGVSPEIATELARLSVDLQRVETFSTLQHAVARALDLGTRFTRR